MYCTEWSSWTVLDGLTCLVPELRHVVVGQLYVGITQGLHVVYKATNVTLLLQLINQGLSRLYPPLLQIVKEGKILEQTNQGLTDFFTEIYTGVIYVPHIHVHVGERYMYIVLRSAHTNNPLYCCINYIKSVGSTGWSSVIQSTGRPGKVTEWYSFILWSSPLLKVL